MNMAEYIVSSVIRYNLQKKGSVNIIIAGPMYSGIKEIVAKLENFYSYVKGNGIITVLDQDNYYKEFEDLTKTPYGRDYDSIKSFHTQEFIEDARRLIEEGSTKSPVYNFKRGTKFTKKTHDSLMKEAEEVVKIKKKVNIFTGPHAIDLIEPIIQDAITIFIDTDLDICIRRRYANQEILPTNIFGYREYIIEKTMFEIFPQIDDADIVIKCNSFD